MTRELLLLGFVAALFGACGDNECAPGEQVECACPASGKGAQVCLDDGSGFGECKGCLGTGGWPPGSSSSSGGASSSSSSSSSSSGGSECEEACAFAITNGGQVCAGKPGVAIYAALISCASASCPSDCMELIIGGASNQVCGDCLTVHCSDDLNDCSNDI